MEKGETLGSEGLEVLTRRVCTRCCLQAYYIEYDGRLDRARDSASMTSSALFWGSPP